MPLKPQSAVQLSAVPCSIEAQTDALLRSGAAYRRERMIAALKRQQQRPLVKPGARQLLHTLVDAARRSGVPLLDTDAAE